MALYLYQLLYTAESWAAQTKSPQNRMATVAPKICEAAGGKCIGAWYCFGEWDAVLIAEMPDAQSMAAVAIAVAAGGAIKASQTTQLLSGTEVVGALKKAADVSKAYRPAK